MSDIETQEITLLTSAQRVRVLREEIKKRDAEITSLRTRVSELESMLTQSVSRALLEAKP
jgi:hypothetical protein